MPDYTAKIRAKGLDTTGMTEALASNLHANLGTYMMGIVEIYADDRRDNAEGKHRVELVITQFEPATDQVLDEYLRELTKALKTNRVLMSDDGQLSIDTSDDLAPKVADLIAAGAQHLPHVFDHNKKVKDDHVCTCGELEDHPLHT